MYYTIVLWDIVTREFYRLVLCLCFDAALVARESSVTQVIEFGHWMAPLALITNVVTMWRYLH